MIDTPTTSRLKALGAALVLMLGAGCAQKPNCEELGSCGGPLPVGDWMLSAGHPSCSEHLYRAPQDTRLIKGDQPAARLPIPDEALFDWCDLLIFKTNDSGMYDANHVPRYSLTDQTIGEAWIHYDGAGNYAAKLTKTGTYVTDFPATCVRGFGATGDVCGQVQTYLVAKSADAKNIQCVPTPADPAGCTCRYEVSLVSGGAGLYSAAGNTIVHALTKRFPDESQGADFPASATYCNTGSSLQLTGKDGAYLFNEPGLRTLDLGPVTINCTDGAEGPGEDGVDCGLVCGNTCM